MDNADTAAATAEVIEAAFGGRWGVWLSETGRWWGARTEPLTAEQVNAGCVPFVQAESPCQLTARLHEQDALSSRSAQGAEQMRHAPSTSPKATSDMTLDDLRHIYGSRWEIAPITGGYRAVIRETGGHTPIPRYGRTRRNWPNLSATWSTGREGVRTADIQVAAVTTLPQRGPLKALQLDCPNHDITMERVHGEVFYVALSVSEEVKPNCVMAQSVERLRQKLTGEKEFLGMDQPNIARVYDYLLGGKNNFALDRVQADRLLDEAPHARHMAIEGRALHTRIVEHLARLGIMDFADLGCGLPAHPATHETAQAVRPNARVVYVDNDPMVLTHARNLLAKNVLGVTAFGGDIEYPREILYDYLVRGALDFNKPVGVLLSFMLHFYSVPAARKIVCETANCLPTGSYISVSVVHGTTEDVSRNAVNAYTTAKTYSHTFGNLMEIMDGLNFLEEWNPGIVDAHYWPDRNVTPGGFEEREVEILAGVAQKVTELRL